MPSRGPWGESLAAYLTEGGTVVLALKADSQWETATNTFQQFVRSAVPDGAPKQWTDLAKGTTVDSWVRADQSLAVAYLPVGDTNSNARNCIRAPQVAGVIAAIIQARLDPAILATDYPSSLKVAGDLAAARRAALIEAVNRPAPSPVASPPPPGATNQVRPVAESLPPPALLPLDANPRKTSCGCSSRIVNARWRN
jgi:hypothetical protein